MIEKLKRYWKALAAFSGGAVVTAAVAVVRGDEEGAAAGLATILATLFTYFSPKNKD